VGGLVAELPQEVRTAANIIAIDATMRGEEDDVNACPLIMAS
jgi:hypothetical protein